MSESDVLTLPPVKSLVGTWRRFGEVGPVYEVIGVGAGAELPSRDRTVRVRILETGEEVDYPLTALLGDPREG